MVASSSVEDFVRAIVMEGLAETIALSAALAEGTEERVPEKGTGAVMAKKLSVRATRAELVALPTRSITSSFKT